MRDAIGITLAFLSTICGAYLLASAIFQNEYRSKGIPIGVVYAAVADSNKCIYWIKDINDSLWVYDLPCKEFKPGDTLIVTAK